MTQTIEKTVLEEEEIYLVIPEVIEEVKEKIEPKPKKKFFKKYSKSHKKQIDINKLKNKLDANIYRGGIFPPH